MGIEQQLGEQPGSEIEGFTFPNKIEEEPTNPMAVKVEHVMYAEQHKVYVVTVESNKSYYVRSFTDKNGNTLTAEQITAFNKMPAGEQARITLTLVEQGEDKRPENDIYTAELAS